MFDCWFFFDIFDVHFHINIWCLLSCDVSIFGVWYVPIFNAHPPPTVVRFYLECDLYILIVGSSYDVECFSAKIQTHNRI